MPLLVGSSARVSVKACISGISSVMSINSQTEQEVCFRAVTGIMGVSFETVLYIADMECKFARDHAQSSIALGHFEEI